jgi:hypothetical protein
MAILQYERFKDETAREKRFEKCSLFPDCPKSNSEMTYNHTFISNGRKIDVYNCTEKCKFNTEQKKYKPTFSFYRSSR